MRRSKVASYSAALLFFLLSASAVAQSPNPAIYAFAGHPDCGNLSDAPLVADASGNLYGTTSLGGLNRDGCVFELSRSGRGDGWQETVLYSFGGGLDGWAPYAGLVLDKLGNLYGTTAAGGTYNGGVVFELSPSTGGGWTETVLHSFGNGIDGYLPQSALAFDKSGNLYGTTTACLGQRKGGTVFKLSPGQSGWTETVLYSFPTSGADASIPAGGVVIDRKGRLFGNTVFGGANGYGAVFELVPTAGGRYKESVIFSFNVYDGFSASSTPVRGPGGNLYGTTVAGGDLVACPLVGCGTVFEMAEDAQGNWTESVLLAMSGSDGASTLGPVSFDRGGNLYAVGQFGGVNGGGSVFELTPSGNGAWTETVLHLFDYTQRYDGLSPYAGVTVSGGKVFGTTSSGGAYDNGIVFEMNPAN
jgi:uncharacterized repeat protein (TIGR03803 family)